MEHGPRENCSRPCCDESSCPREEFSRLLNPDAPDSRRARLIACKIAEICGVVTRDTLRRCFSQIFEAPPECWLCDEFIHAYEIERDALEGKRLIQLGR